MSGPTNPWLLGAQGAAVRAAPADAGAKPAPNPLDRGSEQASMTVSKSGLEVVRVVGLHWLVDSRSRLRTYRRREGETLEPAYYVVSRPTALPAQGYDEDAEFTGPFASLPQAHAALDRIVRQRSERQAEPAALLRPKQEHC